ncbi:MAG: GIY-YIG nuclease family protein [Luteibacter jiangsuensis]
MPLPQDVVEGLATKAEKIRALHGAGFGRAEIARFLGIRYQHVRNTLINPASPRVRSGSSAVELSAEPESWPIQKLLDAGFHLLADCSISGPDAFGYSALAPTAAGVYAFAVDSVIVYVGLTRGTLRTRLGQYVRGHEGQKTSAHIKARILEMLRADRIVQVLVATPPQFDWNGLPVDGPAGLETGLIRLIKPVWNRQGNK